MSASSKLFYLKDSEINEILFGDSSDDIENLQLDDEDLGLLEDEFEHLDSYGQTDELLEAVIYPPNVPKLPSFGLSTSHSQDTNCANSISDKKADVELKLKKLPSNQPNGLSLLNSDHEYKKCF